MRKAKFGRVQCEARCPASIRNRLATDRTIVDPFATDGMSRFREVDPDLMRSARLQTTRQNSVPVETFFYINMGDRFFAAGRGRLRRAASSSVAPIA